VRLSYFSYAAFFLGIGLFGVSGCLQRGFNNRSELRESFGNYNTAEGLGLSPDALKWQKIQSDVRGSRPKAWSDTWWPHYSKGIADRYILRKSSKTSENLEGREVILSRFVEQYAAAVKKNDVRELSLLSPAEKYDFLMAKEPIPENIIAKMSEYSKKYKSSVAERILFGLEDKLEKLGQYDDSYKSLNQQYAKEANSSASTFMPLLTEGLAINEEVKKYLPVTSHDWNLWLETFSWAHDEEWAWMGICNGWSPAALREAQPRQSVMAIRGGKKILLTEGDIRGLLSWVWGWQFPQQTLGAGVRCDANESRTLVKNKRIIDGRLCEGKGSRPGRCVAANTIYIGKDDPFAQVPGRKVKFGLDPQNRESHQATLKSFLGNAYYEAEVTDLSSGTKRNLLIQLTQACRDMNPGLFHAALVDLVGRRKIGFVVDADRYTQVWNQPVFGYEFAYLPIMKRDGVEAAPGVPVNLSDVKEDPYAPFRSEKANKIVQVRAKVIFGSENGPFASYGQDGSKETHEEMVVDYTLELSREDIIVGGEWGLLPGTPGVKALRASNSSAAVAPDFIWNYPEKSLPLGELVDYSIVKKIHECSTRQAATSKFDLKPYLDEPLMYVECRLD
jgi:hypothetical protein